MQIVVFCAVGVMISGLSNSVIFLPWVGEGWEATPRPTTKSSFICLPFFEKALQHKMFSADPVVQSDRGGLVLGGE